MTHLDSFLAILFADISQSTKLYDTYGNAQALKIVNVTLELLTKQVEKHYGAMIKTIGDENHVFLRGSGPGHRGGLLHAGGRVRA